MTKLKTTEEIKAALAPRPQAEAFAMTLPAGELKEAYGEVSAEHFTVPRLVVLESGSPEVVSDHAGQPGDFYVKGFQQNLGKGPLEIVVLKRFNSRIYWKEMNDGGGILCRADDNQHGVGTPGGACASCPNKEWKTDAEGKASRPLCDSYENYMVVLRDELKLGDAFPFILSGAGARLTGLKSFNTLLMTLMQKQRPLFAKSFVLSSLAKPNPKVKNGAPYHVFQLQPGNENALLPQEEQQAAFGIYQQFRMAKIADPADSQKQDEAAPF